MATLLQLKAYTLMELMLALLLASVLSLTLMMGYVSVKNRFELISALITVQDDARFAITFLRKHINQSSEASLWPRKRVPQSMQIVLHNLSDVLVLKQNTTETAYYVAKTGRSEVSGATALFKKTRGEPREELVSRVTDFQLMPVPDDGVVRGVFYVLIFQNTLFRGVNQTYDGFGAVEYAMQ